MIAMTQSPNAAVAATPVTVAQTSNEPHTSPARPARILVVEDHAVTRDPLARLLRYEGYQTVCAANGAEALAALEAEKPDLVLLDVVMPKVDGLTFLDAVRHDERYKDLPVILLTGLLDTKQLARARALKVRDIITKAKFTVDELMARIRAGLESATAPMPSAA